MTLTDWLSLLTICVLGAMSPGPSLAVVLKHSISNSTSHGLVAAIFHGLGVGIYAVGALLGLVSLMLALPLVFKVLVYAGAAYLFYMGIKALLNKGSPFSSRVEPTKPTHLMVAARDGFAIAFLNPKLAVFFVALFSQFIHPDKLSFSSGALMAGTVLVVDMLWYCIVAMIVHHTKERLALTEKGPLIDKIAGVVFIGLAVRVLFI